MEQHREEQYRDWCRSNRLDPEDTQSAIAYERWQMEHLDEAAQYHWPELAP